MKRIDTSTVFIRVGGGYYTHQTVENLMVLALLSRIHKMADLTPAREKLTQLFAEKPF